MARLLHTVNQADRVFGLYRTGQVPFLIALEAIVGLGCYDITPDSYTVEGVKMRVMK